MGVRYGAEYNEINGEIPPTLAEIRLMPLATHGWTIVQLTKWVRMHNGSLDKLLEAAITTWERGVILEEWTSPGQPRLRDLNPRASQRDRFPRRQTMFYDDGPPF